jgi:hypothetical protein
MLMQILCIWQDDELIGALAHIPPFLTYLEVTFYS